MTERRKIQLLVALLIAAGAVFYFERDNGPTEPSSISADTHFVPLAVEEPALQVDRLKQLQKDEYKGAQKNIFTSAPVPQAGGEVKAQAAPRLPVGPQPVPPPPPLQVAVEFYGVESSHGRKVALFKNGDDPPIIVAEGETFMSRYRLVHIGNQSAEVEEISSGRHATVPLFQPADSGAPN
jgi:hypothetical protein